MLSLTGLGTETAHQEAALRQKNRVKIGQKKINCPPCLGKPWVSSFLSDPGLSGCGLPSWGCNNKASHPGWLEEPNGCAHVSQTGGQSPSSRCPQGGFLASPCGRPCAGLFRALATAGDLGVSLACGRVIVSTWPPPLYVSAPKLPLFIRTAILLDAPLTPV